MKNPLYAIFYPFGIIPCLSLGGDLKSGILGAGIDKDSSFNPMRPFTNPSEHRRGGFAKDLFKAPPQPVSEPSQPSINSQGARRRKELNSILLR